MRPPLRFAMLGAMLRVALLLLALLPAPASAMTQQASGHFEIKMTPGADMAPGVARFTFAKVFRGALEGRSSGEMLSSGSPASGAAGYVAIEQVTGKLDGRTGGFVLQQFGTMDKSGMALKVEVVPGSGTGELAGIAGAMTIDAAAGHAYVLTYTLPAPHAP